MEVEFLFLLMGVHSRKKTKKAERAEKRMSKEANRLISSSDNRLTN